MISLYQFKNSGVCKCYYRTPATIKNLFLLSWLSIAMMIIYLVYFRADGLTIENIPRIIRGLTSKTFNYLATHTDSMRLTPSITDYPSQISANTFMTNCMRLSKPCIIENLAKEWKAYDKWRFEKNGTSYLKSMI